ncbi:hypothetical protein LTS08_000553 [Lithohypha guttulata]|uniref:Uncharacterized protein n=1 Tax=Lithohypha guttulata TaxID=1690604 RepID=A0AAN7T4C8_9EURO|nr:hypothetical protein LTR51_006914 [Lithohypha guttulata]KAK5089045.1 hypothetical protein LTR05_003269 [Lithohypha guttulata]KAK5106434.1 hypothetical protein LTS08_000553 [Lithohypha guttulata]
MPVTTRNAHLRNGTTPQKVRTATPEPEDEPSKRTSPSMAYAGRPNAYLLLIYPAILAIGTLYAVVSPSARIIQEPPSAGMTVDFSTVAVTPNYFAEKRNLVNLLFVKRGWAWTTLAFVFLQLTTRPSPTAVSSTPHTTKERMASHYFQAVLRFLILTTAWVFTTQWFFGPALIDRSFTLTGGHCEGLPAKFDDNPARKLASIYSSAVCKKSGGNWRGGHDVSGHTFMLVTSSACLLYELWIADRASQHPSVTPRAAANVAHGLSEQERKSVGGWESEGEARARVYARNFLYGVVGLDCLMLMTTAIWFHTWLEKVNGMLVAGIGLYITYFLGDYVPAWREIVGGL